MRWLVTLLGLTAIIGHTHAGETIRWMTLDFPPSFVASGPDKGSGYSDVAMQLVIRGLSEFKHETVFVDPPTAIRNLREQANFCGAGLNRNEEREAFMVFSSPFIKRMPNELVILRKNLARFKPYLDKDGKVDFAHLINTESLRMGYHQKRAYGPLIDNKMAEKPRPQLVQRSGSDLTAGFLWMLEAGQIDYIIESPDSLRYFQGTEAVSNPFLSVPIKGADGLLPVYFACSKNEFGKQVIARIDEIVKRDRRLFEAGYVRWLLDEPLRRWDSTRELSRRN